MATYQIVGMHCAACVRKVQAVLEPLAERVEVRLTPPQVVVEGGVPFDRLNAAVKGVGSYKLKRNQEPRNQEPKDAKVVRGETRRWLVTYYPLLLIAGYIMAGALAGALRFAPPAVDWMLFMRLFMAGFFLVFSFFKLLSLRGFVDAYAGYDLLARRWHGYGYVYPFVELGLGLALACNLAPVAVNTATVVVMGFSALGVVKALLDKKSIRCACLGTVLNLPMTSVTLVEDLLMVGMAGVMVGLLL